MRDLSVVPTFWFCPGAPAKRQFLPVRFDGTLMESLSHFQCTKDTYMTTKTPMEFFLNGPELKDLVSHMCLVGAVVSSWSLTQEMAGSSPFK